MPGRSRPQLREVGDAREQPVRPEWKRHLPNGQTTTGGAIVIVLLAARTVGVTIPGTNYVHKVFSDPLVFFFVRLAVVGLLALGTLWLAWVAGSLLSHIRNKRWIRRIAGLEPQALHQGAAELERAYDAMRVTVADLTEENAELAHALEMTSVELRAAYIALGIGERGAP